MRELVSRARALALGVAALLGLSAAAPGEPAPESGGFTILQINDTYKIEGVLAGRSGGMARVRSLRRSIEAEGRPVLILHAGDLLFPSVMSRYLKGEAMIAALDLLDGGEDFDEKMFATFGNHEFDSRDRSVLLDRLEQSRFTWLSANLRFRPDDRKPFVPMAGRAPNVSATHRIDVGGVRLGLFGLTAPGEPRDWIDYGDEARRIRAARSAVRELRARGADYVIALTHEDVDADVRLAKAVPGIDRIVGGHEHIALERRVGSTWITKADADAQSVVRIDVERRGNVLVTSQENVKLDESVPRDPALADETARWLTKLDEAVFAAKGRRLLDVVATTEHALEGMEPSIRGRETALGNLLADSLRDALETDVALVNGGTVRVNDDVPAGGELRVYEVEGIFYYEDPAVTFELTGAELLELLTVSVSDSELAHGRFLQVSGIRFRYHAAPGAAVREKWIDAAEVEVRRRGTAGWKPLELGRTYSAATTGWLWMNGCRDGFRRFGQGCGGESPRQLERSAPSFRELVEAEIARLPGRRIRTAIDGRIVRVDSDAPVDGNRGERK